MPLVPSQSVHLQLDQVHLGRGHHHLRIRFVFIAVLAVLAAPPFRADTLDAVLVEVTDVLVTGCIVRRQLESPLRDRLLDPCVI